jgi:hypothetical protein
MDALGWMGWYAAFAAMGMAATALNQIASLKREVKALTDELRRRGLLEQTVGERKIIVPDSLQSK